MKIYVFEYETVGDAQPRRVYKSGQDANLFEEALNETGKQYTIRTYATLLDCLKDSPVWRDEAASDGEALDEWEDIIKELGV